MRHPPDDERRGCRQLILRSPPGVRRLALLALLAAAACSPRGAATRSPAPAPSSTLTPKAVAAGGDHPMGTTVRTRAGSFVKVGGWTAGAPPQRREPPGPHQGYETIEVSFCAGPDVQESASDLATLFSLELPNGNRVAPDSIAGEGELKTKGTVQPGECEKGDIVFQVSGGAKPAFVDFASDPLTRWKVP